MVGKHGRIQSGSTVHVDMPEGHCHWVQLEGRASHGMGCASHLSKRTDTRSMATITDSLSGAAGLGSEVLPGLAFSFPETAVPKLI